MTAVSVRIPEQLADRLNSLAEQTGRSKTFYILEALNDSIDDLEDAYLAQSRLSDVRRGKTDTVSLESVIAESNMAKDGPAD